MSRTPSPQLSPVSQAFDPSDLSTYKLDVLVNYPLSDLVHHLNAIPRNLQVSDRHSDLNAAKINVLRALCVGFSDVRRKNDTRTLQRTPMFAIGDAASRLRPSIGLKRTFPTGIFSTTIINSPADDDA
ncbi:UL35 protein [Gallid alphaherpesvirus 3]|uniref:Small capsomere-interacting protein n=2 Tax=Gallid alphaherpesvirus 3 TaxID=35250 RepID=A0A1P7U0D2_9ALPH|nr:small capsid protein [Gallid alphaherpesvirus 3]YP_010795632.1 UL35 protein [Gallid alphaherpesvirus 3]BAA78724.1 UL35 protein [Marek's disease virus serotype 2 MDV2]AEI00241.1 UL35 protein [Gallid alphaherpesvirus 3]QEY02292.1 UL35 protein [Gallid alphaherpesvirus 3]BAA82931.1 UL35 product homolog [Marek's disease virus serotype 2 MDV2]BAB16545.1 UL35 protein [Gallid alphaherpesvirus 3]